MAQEPLLRSHPVVQAPDAAVCSDANVGTANNTTQVQNIAAAATTNFDSSELGAAGSTARLLKCSVGGRQEFRADLIRRVNGADTTYATKFGLADTTVEFDIPTREHCIISTSAGDDRFRVAVTNNDGVAAADYAVNFHWTTTTP